MNGIFSKLRKFNKNKYRQFEFCLIVSITLVSSFATLLMSNMIKEALPAGGDSQMQAGLLFIIDLVGCFLLIWYAENLYIKSRSRELGVFLALGTDRNELRKQLVHDTIPVVLKCSVIGIISGNILTYIIWNAFRVMFGKEQFIKYQFSAVGLVVSIIFCVFVVLFVQKNFKKYVKRINIIDLIYAQNKNESVNEATKIQLFCGIILTVLGIFLGYVIPILSGYVLHKGLPGIWKITYLFAIVGIYQILVYCVSFHKKGKNPVKYYKNIIAYSMMKFQGKQNVRSMCVIALLLFGGLFAVYYPLDLITVGMSVKNDSADFSIPFRTQDAVLSKSEIESLANKYQVDILDYKESYYTNLLTGMVERDLNENKELVSELVEKDKYCDFIDVDQYNNVFGTDLQIASGEYYAIVMPDNNESYFEKPDDLQYVYDSLGNRLEVSYAGKVENGDLLGANLGNKKYILNEQDFKYLTLNSNEKDMVTAIIFDVGHAGDESGFAKDIYNTILSRTSEEAAVNCYYDPYQEELAKLEGNEYQNADKVELSEDNVNLMNDWKYYPLISEIYSRTMYQSAAILLFLFSYIAIICLVAVMIILYTRSITLGINNQHIYLNLYKLGANKAYVRNCIKGQIRGIFFWSTAIGCLASFLLKISFLYGNDLHIAKTEIVTIMFMIITGMIIFALVHVVYKRTINKIFVIIDGGRKYARG